MTGRWLTSVTRRLTRPDTFEHLISPAIADLQQELASGFRHAAAHYAGLLGVVACAVARDLRVDASSVANTDAWRTIWRPSLRWFAGGLWIAALLWRSIPWHLLDPATRRGAMVTVLLSTVAAALIPTVGAATFHLRRRDPGLRVWS